MKARALLAVLLLATVAGAQDAGLSACIACHADASRVTDEALRRPVALFVGDVHRQAGLSCHDCHGGNPALSLDVDGAAAASHAADAGFVGSPSPAETPAFCGRCHSDAGFMVGFDPTARIDQEALFSTSVHGRELADGDENVATCISCHGSLDEAEPTRARAHGILAVTHPRSPVYPPNVATTCAHCHADAALMKPYGIPTDQFADYETSVHRSRLVEHEDLSAPTCNDCHGNHGARPPAVESMTHVCGTCHVRQAQLFRESSMLFAFDMMELGECTVCHGNHAVLAPSEALLLSESGGGDPAVMGCTECHSEPEDPALAITDTIHGALSELDARLAEARATITDAERRGMLVSEAQYRMAGAEDALIDGRTLVHLFQAEPIVEVAEKGRAEADAALAMGVAAIEAYFFRHRWMAISLVGIAIVIFTLVLKVRQVDRRWRANDTSS